MVTYINIEEALHLATMLCKFGYFFHVTGNGSTVVKQDSELFRFQVFLRLNELNKLSLKLKCISTIKAPYFWVSTNWNAGNTDYGNFYFR